MSFKLVYLSQTDPQWKGDVLGFGDPTDTIGMYGCALTSVSMLVSGHGFAETPKSLNNKMKAQGGFVSSGIRWEVVSKVHSEVKFRENIFCENVDAPLAKIDAALAAGQPVVVRVDSSPAPGLQWHYVLLYGRKGSDYLMLDPYPYTPGTNTEDLLMARYSQGNPLTRSIQQVIIYECTSSGGPISMPAPTTTTTSSSPTPPVPSSPLPAGPRARVKDEVTWGLNIRSSTDTSSLANLVVNVPAGTELLLLDSDGESKIGIEGQWVRVRTAEGKQGFTAAWFLDKVSTGTTTAPTPPTSSSSDERPTTPPSTTPSTPPPTPPPVPIPSTPPPAPSSSTGKLMLKVSKSVGERGLRLRKAPSMGGALVMTLKAGAKLTVIEPANKAKAKVGSAGKWIQVSEAGGKRGYVAGDYVELA